MLTQTILTPTAPPQFLSTLSLAALAAAAPLPQPLQSSSSSPLQARNGAGSVVTNSNALAWFASNPNTGVAGYSSPTAYTCYSGAASNFPAFDQWMDFTAMWNLNVQNSLSVEEDSTDYDDMLNSINSVSASAQVDARLILAVIMQESTGNVNVACTNNGVENCGIMQASAGSVSFDASNAASSIQQMIIDGTQGTSGGPGLVNWFNSDSTVNGNTAGNPYNVARGYNSGSIDLSNLSDGLGSTPKYVSDVANRLLGWDGNGSGSSGAGCGF
ncbi:MAG: hypothetical protein M1819_004460 [Sarea resinae]|nr:MAG: hypothetical protein M1819_004460 [Sarea resinae]